MKSNTAMRASAWVLKLVRSSSSHSSVAKKTFAHSVVETISHRAHRRPYAGLVATLAEGQRGVLATVVGVMNHPGGAALPERQVECRHHQFGAQMSFHRPAHNL